MEEHIKIVLSFVLCEIGKDLNISRFPDVTVKLLEAEFMCDEDSTTKLTRKVVLLAIPSKTNCTYVWLSLSGANTKRDLLGLDQTRPNSQRSLKTRVLDKS